MDCKEYHAAHQEPGEEPKVKKPRGPRYIVPCVENFRRSKAGFRLIAQELRRLLKEQARTMPEKALLDHNGTNVQFAYQGKKGTVTLAELEAKAGHFFASYLIQVKKKVLWGSRVQSWLAEIEKSITKDYKSKSLHELVWLINSSQLAETKGYLG